MLSALNTPTHPVRDCLGCRNCAGLCWSLIELHRIPDAVLRTRKP